MTNPRRFYLQRDQDISGVSGTGRVCNGVQWPDGSVSLRWLGAHPKIDFAENMGVVEFVHLHGGATRIVWLDTDRCDAVGQIFDEEAVEVGCDLPRGHAGPHCDPMQGGWGEEQEPAEKPALLTFESCGIQDTLNGQPVSCVYLKGHTSTKHYDRRLGLWEED